MPLKLEHKLQAGAESHGFKKGTKRYNAYVYGTMNKMGMLTSNHAGSLAPDKMIGKIDLDYRPTFANVHGIYIGITVAIILLIVWHVNIFHPYFLAPSTSGTNAYSGPREHNGTGASGYIAAKSGEGWVQVQYNSLGANAGVLYGESN